MEITFKRRIVNELLTTYLPSFLLLFICYATTKFKAFYFEAAVTVNLTVMLVATTLFIRWIFPPPNLSFISSYCSSGLVLMENVTWMTFHSAYDFGYLLAQVETFPLSSGFAWFSFVPFYICLVQE